MAEQFKSCVLLKTKPNRNGNSFRGYVVMGHVGEIIDAFEGVRADLEARHPEFKMMCYPLEITVTRKFLVETIKDQERRVANRQEE